MANINFGKRKTIRTDSFGVKRCAVSIYIPIDIEAKAQGMIKKMKAPNGLICQSVKAVCEAIIEHHLSK